MLGEAPEGASLTLLGADLGRQFPATNVHTPVAPPAVGQLAAGDHLGEREGQDQLPRRDRLTACSERLTAVDVLSRAGIVRLETAAESRGLRSTTVA